MIPIEGEATGQANLSFTGTDFKTASGNLTADIAANAGTTERGLVPVSGRVELTANNGLFNVDVARLNTEKSEFTANGNFDLGGDNSNLNVALNSSDASEIERIVRVLNLSPKSNSRLILIKPKCRKLEFNGTLTEIFPTRRLTGALRSTRFDCAGANSARCKPEFTFRPPV